MSRGNHWVFWCADQPEHCFDPRQEYTIDLPDGSREYVTARDGYVLETPLAPRARDAVRALARLNAEPEARIFPTGPWFWNELLYGEAALRHQLQALAFNHQAAVVWRNAGVDSCRCHGDSQTPIWADRYGVGSARPRLWVLGERTNPRAPSHPLPFGTTAGTQMLWPHVVPRRVRVSNVLQPSGHSYPAHETIEDARLRLPRDWQALGQPAIVAVGGLAARVLRGLPAVEATLDHPQFVWRFHHDEVEAWSEHFRRLVEDL